jgi:hypothetical protein
MKSKLVYRERGNVHYIVREFDDRHTPAELVYESRNVRDVEFLLPQLQRAEGNETIPQSELQRQMESAPRISMREAERRARDGYTRTPATQPVYPDRNKIIERPLEVTI